MKNTSLMRLPDGTLDIRIPEIPRVDLQQIMERVQYYVPESQTVYDIRSLEPIDRSFTWDLEKAVSSQINLILHPVLITDAYHTYGYYGIFKPSLSEVFASLPEDMVQKVKYFSLQGPKTADDLNRDKEITNAGYHHSIVTWYK